jgi:hypothetical protein
MVVSVGELGKPTYDDGDCHTPVLWSSVNGRLRAFPTWISNRTDDDAAPDVAAIRPTYEGEGVAAIWTCNTTIVNACKSNSLLRFLSKTDNLNDPTQKYYENHIIV